MCTKLKTVITPLRKARESRRLQQHEVAARAEISQGHYCRIERGSSCPRPEVVKKLARIFRRQGVTEMHILFPGRFRGFEPV